MRMISALLIGLALLTVSAPLAVVGAGTEQSDFPEWIKNEKIRGYWSAPLEVIESLHEAGLNTLINRHEIAVTERQRQNDYLWENYSFQDVERKILAESALCRKLGIHFFYCLDTGASWAIVQAGFENNPRRYHDGHLPCPLDAVYWDRVVAGRFKYIVKLLNKNDCQLDGLIIDPEMYAFTGAMITIPCYCNDCAREFAKVNPALVKLTERPIEKRAGVLVAAGQTKAYENWQYITLRDCVAQLRREIHAQRPDLILGFLIYKPVPWFNALAAGLATERLPVLICPEGTYSGSYNDAYLAYQQSLDQQISVPYLFCPGISVGYDFDGTVPNTYLEVVPGNLYHRAIRSDGYWIYAHARWGSTRQKSEPFTPLIRQVNDELDKYLASNDRYKSKLKPKPLPVERPDNLQKLLLDARAWRQVSEVPNTVPKPTTRPVLRGQDVVVIKAEKNQEITITLHTIQLAQYTNQSRMVLYDPAMVVLADRVCPIDQTISYRFTAKNTGPYVLVVAAGLSVTNAYTLDVQGAPWVLTEEDGVQLNTIGGRVYFGIPQEKKSFELQLAGHPTETVSYRLYDPAGQEVLAVETLKQYEKHMVNSRGKAGIWCLEVYDIVDDAIRFGVTGINRYAFSPDNIYMD